MIIINSISRLAATLLISRIAMLIGGISIILQSLLLTACASNSDKEYISTLDSAAVLRAKDRASHYSNLNLSVFTGKYNSKTTSAGGAKAGSSYAEKDTEKHVQKSTETTNTKKETITTSMKNIKIAKAQKRTARDDIEEYVSRIGKRILIVIDSHTQNYEFAVSNSSTPSLMIDKAGEIQISLGLLNMLDDEAELAAVLSQKIAALKNSSLYLDSPTTENQAMEIDKYGMIYMSRAGYDPKAAVELQELYLNQNNPRYGSWLNAVYADNPPTADRLSANRNVSTKLPAGLQRGKDRYSKNIGKT